VFEFFLDCLIAMLLELQILYLQVSFQVDRVSFSLSGLVYPTERKKTRQTMIIKILLKMRTKK
jgi:hypothetical protein